MNLNLKRKKLKLIIFYILVLVINPILLRQIYRQGGQDFLKFGENMLEYNNAFRFYITTRLRNPHYLPELSVKVSANILSK